MSTAGNDPASAVAHFTALTEYSPDAIVLSDARGEIVYLNGQAEGMFGYTPDELVGRPVEELVPSSLSGAHRLWSDAFTAAPSRRAAEELLTLEGRRKDGSTFPLEIRLGPVDVGATRLVCSAVRDITERLAVEAALRDSKRFIEAVEKASAPLIYVFDLDGLHTTYANRAILIALGYPSTAPPLTRLEELMTFMPESELPHLAKVLSDWQGLQDGQVREDEYQLRDASGGIRWFLARETIFSRREDGSVREVMGTLFDITRRKHAEEAVERNRALLQSFVEHVPAAVAMLDRDLRYVAVSRRWVQDFGLEDRTLTGLHHYEVFPEIRSMLEWRAIHQRCLEGAVERRDEDAFARTDGRVDWVRWEIRPWLDAKNAIGGIMIFTEVITDRRLAEAKLRESQLHLAASQQIAGVGSWEMDLADTESLEGNRIRWSDECYRVFGYDAGSTAAVDGAFWRRIHAADKPRIIESFQQVVHTGIASGLDHRILLEDGTERIVHQEAALVRSETGEPLKLIGVAQDVTDRLRLEEQLRQSQKMHAIGQLAGGIAHDFNNLLTIITGHSEMLLSTVPTGDPRHEDLAAIHDAGERAALLTRQLLLFTRKAILEPGIVNCNELIQRTCLLLRRIIREDVTITTTFDPALDRIRADPGQIEQVIMNLSLNARDAMPRGGQLFIETRNAVFDDEYCRKHPEYQPGRFVQLTASDTGHGIAPGVKAHLFEPFFTTKGPGKGTGLGLATVYGIVQQLGGFITVTSDVEAGASFKLFLPAFEAEEASRPPETSKARQVAGTETILLAEDDDGIRQMVKVALQKYGYTVLDARNGVEALSASRASGKPIHLLLTDVVMPEMNGPALAEVLTSERPGCRVLFMSGYNEELVLARSLAGRPETFIQKPFATHALLSRIRELLDTPAG